MRERISEAAQLILPGVRSNILIIIILMMMMAIMIARRESSSKILSSPSSYQRLDMLGYGCTSASAVLGEGTVFSQLASRCHNHFRSLIFFEDFQDDDINHPLVDSF